MSRPARVLHLLASLQVGGAETLVMNVFRHIDRSRIVFDAAVHTEMPGFYEEEFRALGGRIFRLPYPSSKTLIRYFRRLQQVLREGGPFSALHSHVYSFSGLPLLGARASGIPIRLAHSHTTSDGKKDDLERTWYRRAMKRLIYINATHLVGCSESACEQLFGTNRRGTEVLRNAIDPDAFPSEEHETRRSVRSSLGLCGNDFILAHIGRPAPAKNHARLIEIFAELGKIIPQARLILVGAGLKAGLEDRCRALGVGERVTFLGLRNDVPRVLTACDAFVFPSLYEGLGLAVVEAQMAGLPCISSDAVPEEADIGLGLLQRLSLSADNTTWAKAILAASKTDRPRREDRERHLLLAGFDLRDTIRRWQALYLDTPVASPEVAKQM